MIFLNTLIALWPIALSLLFGWSLAKLMSTTFRVKLTGKITYLVWLLLAAIGFQFGKSLDEIGSISRLLQTAFIFALFISLIVCAFFFIAFKSKKHSSEHNHQKLGILPILIDSGLAFSFVGLGIIIYYVVFYFNPDSQFNLNVNYFLYLLLIFIGLDISHAPFRLKELSPKILWSPVFIIFASAIGGLLVAWGLKLDWRYGILLSSGYGWFSLSGIMVTAQLGEYSGALALITDLLRELLSILFLYVVSQRHPLAAVATTGATGMDTTLPIVKKTCGNHFVPSALYIGFSLSLIAPFTLAFSLSLFK